MGRFDSCPSLWVIINQEGMMSERTKAEKQDREALATLHAARQGVEEAEEALFGRQEDLESTTAYERMLDAKEDLNYAKSVLECADGDVRKFLLDPNAATAGLVKELGDRGAWIRQVTVVEVEDEEALRKWALANAPMLMRLNMHMVRKAAKAGTLYGDPPVTVTKEPAVSIKSDLSEYTA